MARLVDSYRLTRFPPRIVVITGTRYSFEVDFDRPWWTFQVTKHADPPETVGLCSNPRGRRALEGDLFERGFILGQRDPRAKAAAEWLVRRGYAVKGRTTV